MSANNNTNNTQLRTQQRKGKSGGGFFTLLILLVTGGLLFFAWKNKETLSHIPFLSFLEEGYKPSKNASENITSSPEPNTTTVTLSQTQPIQVEPPPKEEVKPKEKKTKPQEEKKIAIEPVQPVQIEANDNWQPAITAPPKREEARPERIEITPIHQGEALPSPKDDSHKSRSVPTSLPRFQEEQKPQQVDKHILPPSPENPNYRVTPPNELSKLPLPPQAPAKPLRTNRLIFSYKQVIPSSGLIAESIDSFIAYPDQRNYSSRATKPDQIILFHTNFYSREEALEFATHKLASLGFGKISIPVDSYLRGGATVIEGIDTEGNQFFMSFKPIREGSLTAWKAEIYQRPAF